MAISGPSLTNTVDLQRRILRHPTFRAGLHRTALVDDLGPAGAQHPAPAA